VPASHASWGMRDLAGVSINLTKCSMLYFYFFCLPAEEAPTATLEFKLEDWMDVFGD
jgi:hypothetical protein